jgi:hypothetical protein
MLKGASRLPKPKESKILDSLEKERICTIGFLE